CGRSKSADDRGFQFLELFFLVDLDRCLFEHRLIQFPSLRSGFCQRAQTPAWRLQLWSGRRESNPRPTAWKAVTLPLSYSRIPSAAFRFEVPRLRSGFRQQAPASLTPAKRLNLEGCDSTTELLPPKPSY